MARIWIDPRGIRKRLSPFTAVLDKTFEENGRFLPIVAVLSFALALYVALRYAGQIPLDLYAFRQTQTALTAYWFLHDGFSFAYQTPVAGPPWSIPFEFPLYQALMALVSAVSGLSLDTAGRLLSFIFLVLCLWPIWFIGQTLKIPRRSFLIFTILFFSSPVYLYWGRTVMIETLAVFLSLVGVKYFIDVLFKGPTPLRISLYLLFISLGILQKATTGLPVLAVLSWGYLIACLHETRSLRDLFLGRRTVLALLYFAIPLMIGIAWTLYTDHVKELNGLGQSLTSSALSTWNWGTLDQRFSTKLFGEVLWHRMIERNLAGLLGVAIIFVFFYTYRKIETIIATALSIIMGVSPLLLFTNLHIIHDYYQTANLVFLIWALAVALSHVTNQPKARRFVVPVLLVLLGSNYFWFAADYASATTAVFDKQTSRDYAVASVLKRDLAEDETFIAFGVDWNSTLSYLSGHKSFSVPVFFSKYAEIAQDPDHFMVGERLGAVVTCGEDTNPNAGDLVRWASKKSNWHIGQVQNCYLAIAGSIPPSLREAPQVDCGGHLDIVQTVVEQDVSYLSVAGWMAPFGEDGSDPVFMTLTDPSATSPPLVLETTRVYRPDVNAAFSLGSTMDVGFSTITSTEDLQGRYIVGLARAKGSQLEVCSVTKEITIE